MMLPPARTILKAVADRTVEFDFTVWQWGDAIAMDGLLDAGELLGETKYIEHVERFYRQWMKRELSWQDHLCPGSALLRLHKGNGNQSFLDAGVRLAKLLKSAPRAKRGGAPMYRPDLGFVRGNVWVDTLYHEPSFLCQLARLTGEA
ncbi:MAG TPA: glycoside hydrolase family 88 protein, partial [Tepidisphaeraceae bacterium]|nr:glycoside hydrolase family 88 protein [Tepidisphaeraceae bacterium]